MCDPGRATLETSTSPLDRVVLQARCVKATDRISSELGNERDRSWTPKHVLPLVFVARVATDLGQSAESDDFAAPTPELAPSTFCLHGFPIRSLG
jgi:hypothetical protein